MSDIPADLRFAESHEWARLEADGTVTVGISDHAQEALGDVVFVELAEVGAQFGATDQAGVVESVKAASDIYAPVAEKVGRLIVSLPMFTAMTEADVERAVAAVKAVLKKG